MFWLNKAHADGSTFMPPQASEIAAQYDSLYTFLVYACLISCVLVIGGMIYFALKYRRRSDNDKTAYIAHNGFLEFIWSFIPFLIFMFVFAWGWKVFHDMRTMPKDALEINVVGQKWSWDFLYKSGRKVSKDFVVPINTPVKLIMTSKDVIHSFFIPAFRIKQDVVPGRYTGLWFEANKLGNFQVFCAEYCGEGHSAMLAKVIVKSKEDYENWLQADLNAGQSPVELGQAIFTNKCAACHNTDEQKKVGPGMKGLFGATREFVDGSSASADENYIRESMLNPNAKVVKGFPAAMTPFAGQLEEEDIINIIEYIKTLK